MQKRSELLPHIAANFRSLPERPMSQHQCDEHLAWLLGSKWSSPGSIGRHGVPEGMGDTHVCVDVLGMELAWMNETFPKEKYIWYLWFESVFIVPKGEMLTMLLLRWPQRKNGKFEIYVDDHSGF